MGVDVHLPTVWSDILAENLSIFKTSFEWIAHYTTKLIWVTPIYFIGTFQLPWIHSNVVANFYNFDFVDGKLLRAVAAKVYGSKEIPIFYTKNIVFLRLFYGL